MVRVKNQKVCCGMVSMSFVIVSDYKKLFSRDSGCTQKFNLQGRKFCAAYNAHCQESHEEASAAKNRSDIDETSSRVTEVI